MKKEIHPAVLAVVILLAVGGLIAGVMLSGRGDSAKVDVQTLSPEDLNDPEPVKRGQPGYRERTTDPISSS